MRILVLGGTRFIGRAVVEELARVRHDLLVVHRGRSEAPRGEGVEHLHADRAGLASHRRELAGFAPDAVVDTYAMSGPDAEAALAALPGDVRRVVLSSMDVYRAFGSLTAGAVSDPVPLGEDAPLREQRYPYRGQRIEGMDVDTEAYEKQDVEEVYRERGGVACRLPFVYGPRDHRRREEWVLRRVRAGRRRIPVGAGSWVGSRAHVADVARGVRLAVESDLLAGQAVNLAEASTPPMRVWAEQILAAAGSGAALVRVPDAVLPPDLELTAGGLQPVLASSERARRAFGYEDGDPEELVRDSVSWHLAHPPERPDPGFADDEQALAAA